MNKAKRTLLNFLLSAVTFVLLVSLSTPAFSRTAPASSVQNARFSGSQPVQSAQVQPSIYQLMSDLQEAESVLLAQTPSARRLQRYLAVLTDSNIVPDAPSTSATGAAGAVLVGDRLIVRGNFNGLSSPLRDYATDPVNPPNPNITSGIHVHQGESTENGPFQYALTVTLDETELGGRFAGDYTLTSEQLQALSGGALYVDVHTQQNRAGELRGILEPAS